MKTIIAGTRTASRRETGQALLNCPWLGEITEVVSGMCRGADQHGADWARSAHIPVHEMPADWKKHGRAAGPKRNAAMARYADALIAVWDSKSRGTKNMIEEARRKGLQVFVHRIPVAS